MPKGIPLTQAELEQRRHEIAQTAVGLFTHHGFTETSMREIAAAVSMGRSTLYDYFHSKEEIIVFVIKEHVEILISQAEAIIADAGAPSEKLRRVMHMHLAFSLDNRAFYFRLINQSLRLKTKSQQRIQGYRHVYEDMIKTLIEDGITDGCFREVDPTMVTKTLISIMAPVVYTSRPSGSPENMLDAALDIILNGIQK